MCYIISGHRWSLLTTISCLLHNTVPSFFLSFWIHLLLSSLYFNFSFICLWLHWLVFKKRKWKLGLFPIAYQSELSWRRIGISCQWYIQTFLSVYLQSYGSKFSGIAHWYDIDFHQKSVLTFSLNIQNTTYSTYILDQNLIKSKNENINFNKLLNYKQVWNSYFIS